MRFLCEAERPVEVFSGCIGKLVSNSFHGKPPRSLLVTGMRAYPLPRGLFRVEVTLDKIGIGRDHFTFEATDGSPDIVVPLYDVIEFPPPGVVEIVA